MNRELRQIYRDIANIGDLGLCNFCKFASFSGNSCCDSELECEHPLPIINGDEDGEQPYNVWSGSDCWGFRPDRSLQECAILASIYHDNNVPHQNKKGEWVAIIPNESDKEKYGL